MRGSVTELMKNRGYGSILGEDGCVVYFDEKALDGSDFRALSIGNWVEYEEQYRENAPVRLRSGPSLTRRSQPLIAAE